MQLYKEKIKDAIVFIVFAAMLILGTMHDFKISDKLFLRNNWINFFVELIAKMPVYFLGMYACVGLFNISKEKNKPLNFIFMAIYALGGCICGMLMLEDIVSIFLDSKLKYVIAFALAIVAFILLIKFLKVDAEQNKKLKKEYLILIISIAIVVVLTFILKSLIDRTRFIEYLDEFGKFTPWFTKGNGGDSCPSGHMASIVLLFAAIPLLKNTKIITIKDGYIYLILMVISICVALSRISHGMHYMSDVAIAGLMAFIVSKIVTWLIIGIGEDKLEIKAGSLIDKL